MARPTSRRSLRFENLEDRQLLSSAAPNNDQQLALQLINMARTTPQAAAQWLSSSTGSDVKRTLQHYNVNVDAVMSTISSSRSLPPVAWNSDLAEAAQSHSDDMATNQYQSHTGSDGTSADDRVRNAGYKADSTGENAFAYANSVENSMQAFLYDWGVADAGHRRNLLQPGVAAGDAFSEVGVGVAKTSGNIGPVVVTQNFASRSDAPTQLVGVVYGDKDGDGFYSAGEGQGNIEIDAVNLETGAAKSTRSWESGGYQIPLSAGRYQVTATEKDVVIKQTNVTVSNVNVAQDFVTSRPWDGRMRQNAVAKPVKQVAVSAPVVAPTSNPAPVTVSTPVAAPAPVAAPSAPAFNNGKVAVFAPDDWKGPELGSTTQAPTESAPASRSPLAAWTTWKAKAKAD